MRNPLKKVHLSSDDKSLPSGDDKNLPSDNGKGLFNCEAKEHLRSDDKNLPSDNGKGLFNSEAKVHLSGDDKSLPGGDDKSLPRKKKSRLTDKEEELMRMLWEHGPMFVSSLVELYPEPKPHFNTVSTVIRRLEAKGFVAHTEVGGSYRYHAVAEMESFRNRSLGRVIKDYFKGSYYSAVSALVADEKISADELRELLNLVESKKKK